jgi:hypothetical protein
MKPFAAKDRREAWTIAIGAIAAVVTALVGVVLDLPKTLQGFVGDHSFRFFRRGDEIS